MKRYTGYVILNKPKKKGDDPIYQYPFAFSGTNIYYAQVLDAKHLPSLRKDRIHNIMKVQYEFEDGNKMVV